MMHDIHGLSVIHDFIDGGTEKALLAEVDNGRWCTALKRRVQHFGYQYNYTSRNVSHVITAEPLPSWCSPLLAMFGNVCEDNPRFNQLIINEYKPGQDIAPHIDCVPCFGPVVISLSLGAQVEMDFTREGRSKQSLLLLPRTLAVFTGDARYVWHHGIAARKTDVVNGVRVPRERRISLTFRCVSGN